MSTTDNQPHSLSAVPYIDTHCHHHMTSKQLNITINELYERHFPANLEKCVNVLCDVDDIHSETLFEQLVQLDWMAITLGIHPHGAKHYSDDVESVMVTKMQHPKVVAWGEIGLDYHYDSSPREIQQSVFIRQIQAAVRCKKPIIIHTREAEDDTWKIMTEHIPKEWRVHVHCFTDSPEFAANLINHFPNLFIGMTGVVTYTSAANSARVAVESPLSRLLLETDSPFMVPTKVNKPFNNKNKHLRVKTCHSGYIPYVAERVASLRGIGIDEVMTKCTENARIMYGI